VNAIRDPLADHLITPQNAVLILIVLTERLLRK
jgi:hypothetical protein